MNKNFIQKHWDGDYSLPVSYWLISNVLVGAITLFSMLLIEFLDNLSPSLTFNFWIILAQLILYSLILLWSFRGTWMAASKFKGNKIWSKIVFLVIFLGTVNTVNTVNKYYIPILKSHSEFMFGGDHLGKVSLEVLDNGNTLKIEGIFGNGSYSKINNYLKSHSDLKKIYLESKGGRLKEVSDIAKLIKSRKLSTYVETECLSFCTVVFLSGYPRYSTPNARIGFHSPSFGNLNELNKELLLDEEAINLYKSFQLPDSFIKKIFATPNEKMWYPSYQELVDFGVVSHVSFGGESDSYKSLNKSSLEDTLKSMDLYKKYEEKFPGTIKKIVEIFESGKKEGLNDNQITANARSFLAKYEIKVLVNSTPSLRLEFLKLTLDQMEASLLLGNNACFNLLNGTLNVSKTLPIELTQRELNLSSMALDSDPTIPKQFSDNAYQKVLKNKLPAFTNEELEAIAHMDEGNGDLSCKALIKMYKSFLNLPADERDIAIYGTFKAAIPN